MKTTKHTQGEWIIKLATARNNAMIIHKEQGFPIATIKPIDEREANAKLIAAAPELLEALQSITAFNIEQLGANNELLLALSKGKQAIKKATE